MDQPVPNVSRDDVERIVTRDFSSEDHTTILDLLDEYQSEDPSRRARVQLAVLKLADGSIDMLLREIQEANLDFRDVLSSAEYPTYSWDEEDEETLREQIHSDWAQYQEWLNRGSNQPPETRPTSRPVSA